MRIGEIVETCSVNFVAEGTLHQPPSLGSLVKVELEPDMQLYAVVSFAQTSGLEQGRRAIRRGTADIYDAAIYNEHPELRRTLRTIFQAVLVGWQDNESLLYQQLPPVPPPLHFSVQDCGASEMHEFTNRLYYLRLLLAANVDIPAPQLLVAHLNEIYQLRDRDRTWLEGAARELAALLKNDSETLMSIFYAIDPK